MPSRKKTVLEDIPRSVVWVVGASRGIGRELAREFASVGCLVAATARSRQALARLEKEIAADGGRCRTWVCNVAEERSIHTTARSIEKNFGPVDLLINVAGITSFKEFRNEPMKDIREILESNFFGAITTIQSVLPSMIQRKRGWIINILSTAALKTFTGASSYTASKAALQSIGHVIREEVRRHGIRVSNVYPGATETDMWSKSARKQYRHRMMKPESVAEAIRVIWQLPSDIVVEEIVLRPLEGDIG